jgi:hypothetical protein
MTLGQGRQKAINKETKVPKGGRKKKHQNRSKYNPDGSKKGSSEEADRKKE